MASKIQWTAETWNPTRGCKPVSPGCTNCYAMKQAHRFVGEGQAYEGLTRLRPHGGPVWTGEVRFIPDKLDAPLHWRTPRKIFVNSMSDLFHEDVTNEQIAAVFGVMAACRRHTFQILTKLAERLPKWFAWIEEQGRSLPDLVGEAPPEGTALPAAACTMMVSQQKDVLTHEVFMAGVHGKHWPLPNVHIGVSVENQKYAEERIHLLRQVPAAVHWVSLEPQLGPIEGLAELLVGGAGAPVKWLVQGGESDHDARPFDLRWARSGRDECRRAGVAYFLKQIGSNPLMGGPSDHVHFNGRDPKSLLHGYVLGHPKGGDIEEWPEDLRVRQFPEVRP